MEKTQGKPRITLNPGEEQPLRRAGRGRILATAKTRLRPRHREHRDLPDAGQECLRDSQNSPITGDPKPLEKSAVFRLLLNEMGLW